MNKQLINKYKHEFDHWLNGGKLLCYTEVDGLYYEVTDEKWDFVCDIGFIINDEYSEFRKALAEGKAIEYLGQSSNLWHEVPEPDFSLHPTCYRIKSDEPKFKVGDFVRCTCTTSDASPLRITKFVQGKYHVANSNLSFLGHELEPWTPVKDEWCWFFNDDRIPTISQFVEMDNDITRKYFAVYPNRPKALGSWYKKCEPFLNSLPSYLKDK